MKYIWMKETGSMLAKADSLLEVPYVEPHFGKSWCQVHIPWSHGIQTNDMHHVMCYMNYNMCFVYVVVWCVQNVKDDGACYSHGLTFLIKILTAYKLS